MEFGYFSLAMPGVLNICKSWGGDGEGVARLKNPMYLRPAIYLSKLITAILIGVRYVQGDKGYVASPRLLPTKNTYLLT